MELPVVNHPDYEAKIGDDNKFPIKKFGELANFLKKEKVVKSKEEAIKSAKANILKRTRK